MADNVQITPGAGATIAADSCSVNSVANVLVPLTKVGFGVNDSFAYVTSAAGLPVAQQGTWTVTGTFFQATQPVSLASLPALPSGANAIGGVSPSGDVVNIGGANYTVLRAFLDASTSGNTQLVAATTGKKIRILKYTANANGAVNVYFKSATAGAISSVKYLAGAGAGLGASICQFGHFETTAGEALQVNLSGAVAVGFDILYILV